MRPIKVARRCYSPAAGRSRRLSRKVGRASPPHDLRDNGEFSTACRIKHAPGEHEIRYVRGETGARKSVNESREDKEITKQGDGILIAR